MIDRHVHRVLRALVRLGRDLVGPANLDGTHPRILNNALLMPWFRDCVGALDGTHVSAWCRVEIREGLWHRLQRTHHELAAKALFNRRHASVRNIIESTFGVLKKRFPILKGPMQNYLIATQNNIVLACCTLHNFMRAYSPADEYFNEEAVLGALADAQITGDQQQSGQPIDMSQQGIDNWNEDRRAMAAHMYWNAHN
ncbi:uncharacterized protein [Coffea arabica]|uniref:DDE Tnp4 domain-containing protein n=1 Tax=Coffea arabica TaxID=13443 RepID=A0A6P6UET1_COFAR|nr:uncharacterized protein LOC113710046 [Coffea arabica]